MAATHPRRVGSTARDVASEGQRLNGPARRASLPASSAAPAPPDSPPQRPEVERPTRRQVRGADAEAGSPAGSARVTRGRNPWHFFAFYRPAGSRGCRVEARGRQGHGRAEVQRGLCPTPRGPPPGAPRFHRWLLAGPLPRRPKQLFTTESGGRERVALSARDRDSQRRWTEPLSLAERPFLLGSLLCPSWARREAQIDSVRGKCEDPPGAVPSSGIAGVGDC